jgi:hypothetical protein
LGDGEGRIFGQERAGHLRGVVGHGEVFVASVVIRVAPLAGAAAIDGGGRCPQFGQHVPQCEAYVGSHRRIDDGHVGVRVLVAASPADPPLG